MRRGMRKWTGEHTPLADVPWKLQRGYVSMFFAPLQVVPKEGSQNSTRLRVAPERRWSRNMWRNTARRVWKATRLGLR